MGGNKINQWKSSGAATSSSIFSNIILFIRQNVKFISVAIYNSAGHVACSFS